MGTACVNESGTSVDGKTGDRLAKQRTFRITKERLPADLINTVQGFVRHHLQANALDSELILPREVMDLILFFTALHGSSPTSQAILEANMSATAELRILDVVYTEESGGSTELELQCQVIDPESDRKLMTNSNQRLIEAVAEYSRRMPSSSRQKVWSHAVTEQHDGFPTVLDATSNLQQIQQLLSGMVTAYLKNENGGRVRLKPYVIQSHTEKLANYILSKYNPVKRHKFEGDSKYFSRMLRNYVTAKRNGLISGGVGFRSRC